jgi:penicillin-binding protein 2
MCGKTGTVENYYRGKKQRDHSFFAAFAPRQNPTIAIACIVENGGFGGTVAAPIVSLMIEKYLHDTISKARQPWIERYAGMRIIPARVQAEIDKADSVRRVKEAEKLRLFKEARPVAAVSKPGLPDDLPAKKPNPSPKGRLQAWVQRHPYTAGNWHEPVANHTL